MEVDSGTFDPNDFAWRGLTLTPAAATQIRNLVSKQPGDAGRASWRETDRLCRIWLCAGYGNRASCR